MFELIFVFLVTALALAAIGSFVYLCIKVWWIGASFVTVAVFLAAIIFIHP